MNRLNDKVAVITGGNSGVGAATAKLFAKEGAKVVISARRKEALDAVAEEIKAAGGDVLAVSTDISKDGDPERLVEAALEKYGKIDVLINNAGVLDEGLKAIDKFGNEDLDYITDINVKGTMKMTRAALQKMEKGASVVNVASVAGAFGTGGAAYVSSKAAIIGITKHAALRYQKNYIRFNAVCPGTIVTPMVANMNPAELDQDIFGAMMKHNDLQAQPCMPEDVANILLFLASDESRAITGQIIVSDFGSTL